MASRTKSRGAAGRSKATPKKTQRVPFRARIVRTLRTGRERIQERLARQSDDVWGVALLVLAAVVALSFFGLSGPIGAGISGTLRFLFGVWAFLVPLALVTIGLSLVGLWFTEDRGRLVAGVAAVFVASLALFHLMTGSIALAGNVEQVQESGGAVGALIAFPLRRTIGFWGAFLVMLAAVGLGTLILTRATVRDLAATVGSFGRSFRTLIGFGSDVEVEHPVVQTDAVVEIHEPVAPPAKTAPQKGPKDSKKAPKNPKPKRMTPRPVSVDGYELPPRSLLDSSSNEGPNRGSLEQTAAELQEALSQHGVDARLTRIVPGPTVTRYEIELAPGVKVSASPTCHTTSRTLSPLPTFGSSLRFPGRAPSASRCRTGIDRW